jgi:hypothetical protein
MIERNELFTTIQKSTSYGTTQAATRAAASMPSSLPALSAEMVILIMFPVAVLPIKNLAPKSGNYRQNGGRGQALWFGASAECAERMGEVRRFQVPEMRGTPGQPALSHKADG